MSAISMTTSQDLPLIAYRYLVLFILFRKDMQLIAYMAYDEETSNFAII